MDPNTAARGSACAESVAIREASVKSESTRPNGRSALRTRRNGPMTVRASWGRLEKTPVGISTLIGPSTLVHSRPGWRQGPRRIQPYTVQGIQSRLSTNSSRCFWCLPGAGSSPRIRLRRHAPCGRPSQFVPGECVNWRIDKSAIAVVWSFACFVRRSPVFIGLAASVTEQKNGTEERW